MSGQSAAFHCRARRAAAPKTSRHARRIRNRLIVGNVVPDVPQQQRDSHKPRANSQHLIVGKGLALSAQHMARHGKARANALHARGFARGRRESGHFLPEGASPFPTGRRLRICPKLRETGTLLRGTPRTAFPTGRMRIRRRWNQTFPVCCGGRRGRQPLQLRGYECTPPISFPQRGKVASADPPRGG